MKYHVMLLLLVSVFGFAACESKNNAENSSASKVSHSEKEKEIARKNIMGKEDKVLPSKGGVIEGL